MSFLGRFEGWYNFFVCILGGCRTCANFCPQSYALFHPHPHRSRFSYFWISVHFFSVDIDNRKQKLVSGNLWYKRPRYCFTSVLHTEPQCREQEIVQSRFVPKLFTPVAGLFVTRLSSGIFFKTQGIFKTQKSAFYTCTVGRSHKSSTESIFSRPIFLSKRKRLVD